MCKKRGAHLHFLADASHFHRLGRRVQARKRIATKDVASPTWTPVGLRFLRPKHVHGGGDAVLLRAVMETSLLGGVQSTSGAGVGCGAEHGMPRICQAILMQTVATLSSRFGMIASTYTRYAMAGAVPVNDD